MFPLGLFLCEEINYRHWLRGLASSMPITRDDGDGIRDCLSLVCGPLSRVRFPQWGCSHSAGPSTLWARVVLVMWMRLERPDEYSRFVQRCSCCDLACPSTAALHDSCPFGGNAPKRAAPQAGARSCAGRRALRRLNARLRRGNPPHSARRPSPRRPTTADLRRQFAELTTAWRPLA